MAKPAKTKKIFDGRYEILSIVGRGECSVVYQVRHVSAPYTEAALKVLLNKKGQGPNTDKLRKEALAMVSSRHKYVIRLDDFHSVDDICYLCMEFAPESDLRGYCSRRGNKLPVAQAERFLLQIAEALSFIHQSGIVHRDIKPDNILVVNERQVRLADFGVAVLPGEESSLEELQKGIGTMSYMAPEVFQGTACDKRSDVYCLGVAFYEVLSGVQPFENVPLAQVLDVRKEGSFPHLCEINPEVPLFLGEVIMEAMAFDPAKRFPSAKEFLSTLLLKRSRAVAANAAIQPQTRTPIGTSARTKPPASPVASPVTAPRAQEPAVEKRPAAAAAVGRPAVPVERPIQPKAPAPRPQSAPPAQPEQTRDVIRSAGDREPQNDSGTEEQVERRKRRRRRKRKLRPGAVGETSVRQTPPTDAEESMDGAGTAAEVKTPLVAAKSAPAGSAKKASAAAPFTYQPQALPEMPTTPPATPAPRATPGTRLEPVAAAEIKPIERDDDAIEFVYQAPKPGTNQPGPAQFTIAPEADPDEEGDPATDTARIIPKVLSRQPAQSSDEAQDDEQEFSPSEGPEYHRPAQTLTRADLLGRKQMPPRTPSFTSTPRRLHSADGRRRPATLLAVLGALICVALLLRSHGLSGITGWIHGNGEKHFLPPVAATPLSFPALAEGMYTGGIDLFPGHTLPLTLISFPKERKLMVFVGMTGWSPAEVLLDAKTAGEAERGIKVRSNGFVLNMEGQPEGDAIKGRYTNLITKETGLWSVKPVR